MNLLKKMFGNTLIGFVMLMTATASHAASISLGSSGIGTWSGPVGSFIDFGFGIDSGDHNLSLTLDSATGVTIFSEDCCVNGDQFGLKLDGSVTAWTTTDFLGSQFGSGLFRASYTSLLSAGTHTIELFTTADCCGVGELAWSVSAAQVAPIPEPEIYAMMGVGLGLMGWVSRRRKQHAA